jgi:enoyl-CoA hydratase
MEYENILYEKDHHIVSITMNRPEVHNCLNLAIASELHNAWRTFRDDDDAFVAIMTGAGDKAFSAGWDLKDAAGITAPQPDGVSYDFHQNRVRMYNDPGPCGYTRRIDILKPTIGAINGYCFAAGLETACGLDIRIAADSAEFGFLERRWNLPLGDSGAVRIAPIVGLGRALELLITGRRIDAEEALRIGLVTEIVPKAKLMERARELAETIAELPQRAIHADKEVALLSWGRPLEEGFRIEMEQAMRCLLMGYDKGSDGARAFVEKRKPTWQHGGR